MSMIVYQVFLLRCIDYSILIFVAKKSKFGVAKKRKHEGSGDESDEEEEVDEQDRAVKILTGLLTRTKGDDSTLAKKPLRQFTEADFDRELKELSVKKARLELRELEERNRLYLKISRGVDKFMKAVDIYVEKETSVARTMTVYPDGSSILQAAYEDSVVGEQKE